jgi:hypothetical protein
MFSALGSLFGSALMPALTKALPKALSGISDIVNQDIPSILGGKNIMDVLKQRGNYVLGGAVDIGKDAFSSALQKALDGTTDNPGNVALASQFARQVDMNMNNRTVPDIQPSMVDEQGAGSVNLATLGANKPPLEQEIVDKYIDDYSEIDEEDEEGDQREWTQDEIIQQDAEWISGLIMRYRRGETNVKMEIDRAFNDPDYKNAFSWAFFGHLGKKVTRQDLNIALMVDSNSNNNNKYSMVKYVG